MPENLTPSSHALVSTQWLADHLTEPHVRVIDCTTHMVAQPVGPSTITSGWSDHEKCHIPGAMHIDMVQDLSDPNGEFPYTAIGSSAFANLMSSLQIEPCDHVVLYGQSGISSITRAWFIFYLHGHKHLSILDGGLAQWQASGYETANQTKPRVAASPTASPYRKRGLIVSREDVLKALDNRDVQLINALSSEQFAGTGGAHYGRAGRIPNSLNLPAKEMIDPNTGRFWDLDTLQHKVAHAGISLTTPSIHYCGGGIAAMDWSNQPDCPMVSG